jgi:hypothetical protein
MPQTVGSLTVDTATRNGDTITVTGSDTPNVNVEVTVEKDGKALSPNYDDDADNQGDYTVKCGPNDQITDGSTYTVTVTSGKDTVSDFPVS